MTGFIFLMLVLVCGSRAAPTVHAPSGAYHGRPSDDGDYNIYLGIPYAVVDENNPFSAASPHPGFKQPFEAFQDGTACPQYPRNSPPGDAASSFGSIQCLQLNIYVPSDNSEKLPVMIFIHGGSFHRGEKTQAASSPRFLIRHNVIIVALNYRLGPYGFLCLSDSSYNNQGLKDQILGIKWVKENIAAFGGDLERITLFGNSAGAMSIDLHLLNDGLVNRVILQSGSALTTWMISQTNDSIPMDIAEKLGWSGNDVKEAITFLSSKDPKDVISATSTMLYFGYGHPFTRPCVESAGKDGFLGDFPINLRPKVNGMDIMVGHTDKEVKFMYADNSNNDFYRNYDFQEELSFAFEDTSDVDVIKRFYIGDKNLSEELQSTILDYGSDLAFYYPTDISIERYLTEGASSVYRYMFSYVGDRNKAMITRNFTAEGASHGDELAYIFDISMFEDIPPGHEDQRIIDACTTMWTNFA